MKFIKFHNELLSTKKFYQEEYYFQKNEPSNIMTDDQDLQSVLDDLTVFAHRAVQCEKTRRFEHAAYYYHESARLLKLAVSLGADQPGLAERAGQYHDRAIALLASLEAQEKSCWS